MICISNFLAASESEFVHHGSHGVILLTNPRSPMGHTKMAEDEFEPLNQFGACSTALVLRKNREFSHNATWLSGETRYEANNLALSHGYEYDVPLPR